MKYDIKFEKKLNDAIKSLWRSTNFGMNIQYDTYRNTKQVLKSVRQNHTEKLSPNLTSQGFIITFILNHSLKAVNSLWSSAQSKLPKNIFNLLSGILMTYSQLAKISRCGISPKLLIAPFSYSLNPFFMLLQAVKLIQ